MAFDKVQGSMSPLCLAMSQGVNKLYWLVVYDHSSIVFKLEVWQLDTGCGSEMTLTGTRGHRGNMC